MHFAFCFHADFSTVIPKKEQKSSQIRNNSKGFLFSMISSVTQILFPIKDTTLRKKTGLMLLEVESGIGLMQGKKAFKFLVLFYVFQLLFLTRKHAHTPGL